MFLKRKQVEFVYDVAHRTTVITLFGFSSYLLGYLVLSTFQAFGHYSETQRESALEYAKLEAEQEEQRKQRATAS